MSVEEYLRRLEAAVDQVQSAAYAMSMGRNGNVTTMCVPIAEWDRLTKAKNPGGMTRQG